MAEELNPQDVLEAHGEVRLLSANSNSLADTVAYFKDTRRGR
jgi:hypothetical protein